MNLDQIRDRLRLAHVPSVARETGIPLRTLYRIASSDVVPMYATIIKLERWAKRARR